MGSKTSTQDGLSWDWPGATDRASGVGRASRRIDLREPVRVEKNEPLELLLVEDSDDDAALVLRELLRAGFAPTVHRVTSRSAFVAALDQTDWDVIVSDHTIPGYGGLAALGDLRGSGLDIPFILVSGTIGEAVAVEAMRAGAQDYVLKQDLTRLPVAIARELRERAIRAEQQQMREQLMVSERMASAGMLAAAVAHEINNPLAVAISNFDYAGETVESTLSDLRALVESTPALQEWGGVARLGQLQDALHDAGDGLRRIRDIVHDVKLFSRPDDRSRGAVDIRKVCDSSLRMAWNEIRHRAKLVKEYGDVPLVAGNESRIGQVILNLVLNAAQAIPPGHHDGNEIRVTTRMDDTGWAVVQVSDTGSGIAQQNLDRIFEPFFTTKPVGVGTGLGLAVCRRIVTDLGGTIAVESEVGKGTTFRAAFPPAGKAGEQAAPPPPTAQPRAKRARVLLVDDEVSMGTGVQRSLGRYHDVVFVTRAAEALELVAKGEQFDVVLSDFMMPEMSGMEMHRHLLQASPELARRVVFLTGGAFTAEGQQYLEDVPNRVLEKPFRPADLLAAIAEVTASSPERAGPPRRTS